MKNLFRISGIALVLLSIFLIHSCKKDKPTPPIISTTVTSAIIQTTATSGGNITSDGGATVTAKGVCWNTSASATVANSKTSDGTGTGIFTSSITGLTASTVYFVRAYATNSAGTAYGNEISYMTTAATVPIISTTVTSAITQTTATSGGNITSDGGATVTAKGVCWNTSASATVANSKTSDGTGTGIFTSSIASLTAGRVYYVRAYATNSVGTAYGSSILFTTQISEIIFNPGLNYGTVTDIDGNVYKTITIGTQTWMAENLKTTRFNNGEAINLISNASSWYYYKSQPNYCWNNNDETTYKAAYGALYNEITISRGAICPSGWHVPYDVDWTTLTSYLGGESVAGGKLKETGTTHWLSPNSGATNESGFSALPGGLRFPQGDYLNIGEMGEWYSIMDDYRSLGYANSSIFKPYIDGAFSVCCIKY